MTSVSLGAGLSAQSIEIDYAFLPMGALGLTHRLSLTYKFDTRRLHREPASVQTSVHYSSSTSLPPPSHLHCEEYHGVTVCMDADQREKIKISYEPGDLEAPPAGPQPLEKAPRNELKAPHGAPSSEGVPQSPIKMPAIEREAPAPMQLP